MSEEMTWRPIETAPPATSSYDAKILIVGGPYRKGPEAVLPDGDWWRMRKAQGGNMPTHWMPLPAPPALSAASKEGGE